MKWARLGRRGKMEKPRKLRSAAAGNQPKDLDNELRAQSKRPDGKASSSSPSPSAARSVKHGPPSVKPSSAHTTSAPLPPHSTDTQDNIQQSHHYDTHLNEMAQEALDGAVRRNSVEGPPSVKPPTAHTTSEAYTTSAPPPKNSIGVDGTPYVKPPTTDKTSPLIPYIPDSNSSNVDSTRPSMQSSSHVQQIQRSNTESSMDKMVKEALCQIDTAPRKQEASKRRSLKSSSGSVHSGASSRVSRASSMKSENTPKSILRPTKHKTSNKAHDDDDASKISQGSNTSYSSVFSTTYNKLRSYLHSTARPYKSRRKHKKHDRSQKGPSPKQQDLPSGGKTPRYRSIKPPAGSVQGTNVSSSVCSNIVSPHTQRVSLPIRHEKAKPPRSIASLQLKDTHMLEEEPSEMRTPSVYSSVCNSVMSNDCSEIGPQSDYPSVCSSVIEPSDMRARSAYSGACNSVVTNESPEIGPPSVYSNACNSVKVATKGPATNLSIKTSNGSTHVIDLPWLGNASEGKFHGLYSGPVSIQPHGEGTLVLDGSASLKFHGLWMNGELITPLIDEDEEMSQECTSSNESSRKSSSNEYVGKPSFNEYKKKSYKEKSSDECSKKSTKPSPETSKNEPSHPRPKQKYALGEIAHTPRDMIIHRSNDKAVHSASLLEEHEQAFLKRSNGVWACAILADRTFQPTNAPSTRAHWHTNDEINADTMKLEECMLFVINEDGATKIIKRRYWGKFIRRHQRDDENKEGVVEMERRSA